MDAQDAQAVSAIVSAGATIVLAVITWIYARHTKVMSEAMARQIEPDMQIYGAAVLLSPHTGHMREGFMIRCEFHAWVRNKNSASGSIAEPDVFAILDDGTELKAGTRRTEVSIVFLRGGELLAVDLEYQFLLPHSAQDSMEKVIKLLSPATRFRISCMDNLGIDRGKGVRVTLISRGEGQPA